LQVEALGIVLGTILSSSAVKRNELVSHDIVARSNGRWDLDHPAVVVGNQLVIAPSARYCCVVDKAHSINLEKLESCLIHSFAGITTVGEVGNHRTVMRVGPGSPLKTDLVSSSHHGVSLGVGGIEMANNVVGSIVRCSRH
jgi:hypothetical protein